MADDEVGGNGLISTVFVNDVDKSADKDWETFQEAFEKTSEMWEEIIAAYLESLESPEKEKEEGKEKEQEKEEELENEEEEEKEGKEEEGHKVKEEEHESHVEVESGAELSDEKKAAKEAAKVLKSHDANLTQDSGEHKPTVTSAKTHHESGKGGAEH